MLLNFCKKYLRRIEGLRGEELQNYIKQQKSKDEQQSKDFKDKFDISIYIQYYYHTYVLY